MNRPYVLSIAGLDPSGGAGMLADIKTFEQHAVYGFGVCSALTIQSDDTFEKLNWVDTEMIIDQLRPLVAKFKIAACKIGIVSSMEALSEICIFLKSYNSEMLIVFDPVFRASAGFLFHEAIDRENLKKSLKLITLITPNYHELNEINRVIGKNFRLEDLVNVLAKGGHSPDKKGVDILFENGKASEITAGVAEIHQKHGSGCVLSSAITARLALSCTLKEACLLSKTYTETFLNSNTSLLGYHKQ